MKPTPRKKSPTAEQTKDPAFDFELRLYVAGQTPKSLTALANLRRICENHLEGRYQIEVIDLLEKPQPGAWRSNSGHPTLVRRFTEADQEDYW